MKWNRSNPWDDTVTAPEPARTLKPRQNGLTMVIDKGLGLAATQDLLETCSPFIDFIKLAFGTSLLYGTGLLQEKVALIRKHGVDVYPGGTLLELAGLQGSADRFIERACVLGFSAIEVSEGSTELSPAQRRRLIERAGTYGMRVVSEVGKKDPTVMLKADDVVRQVESDLQWGAQYVIIEGRDSGRGVGVYNDDGTPREALIDAILDGVHMPERLMWEAPTVAQQQYWLLRLGANANLGNVQTDDVVTLEATRVGLRGDTLRRYASAYARNR